ncbi:MAG: cupin domain-containing protein [Patescibacteria group bacterium]
MKYIQSNKAKEIIKKDYEKKIIFSPDDFQQKGHLLQIVSIPPRTEQRLHSHSKQTEVFYILEGNATITINGTGFEAKPGDAFICSPTDIHNVWNKNEMKFKLLVFKISLPENDDDTKWQE